MGNSVYTRDEVNHSFEDDVSNTVEFVLALTYLFGAIIVLCVTLNHIREMHNHGDLCPKKEPQQINPYYATVQWYTLFSLVFFTVYQFGLYLAYSRETFCFNDILIGMNAYYLAETIFYAVGMLRLKLMYLNTQYESATNTVIIVVALCHFTYFVITNVVWFNLGNVTWIESLDPSYPRYCIGSLPLVSIFFIITRCIFIFSLLGSFWHKLNGIMRIGAANADVFKSYALRVTILYATASITTIIGMFVFLLSSIGPGNKILQVISSFVAVMTTVIALCLMTSYYPRAYAYLCCICISCCDPHQKSARYGGTSGDKERKYDMVLVSQFRNDIKTLDVSGAVVGDASPTEVNLTQETGLPTDDADVDKTD